MTTLFNYSALKEFFARVAASVDIHRLCDWSGQPGLILRHDIDLDIEPAFQLSKIEEASGVRSTFFVLMSAETYNPASIRNRAMIRDMIERGFEIGLHFDPVLYPDSTGADLQEMVDQEAGHLAEITDCSVRSVSLHNPGETGSYHLFDNYNNAYDSKIFSGECYLSDSRMVFKTDPWAFIEKAKNQAVQLLLHPLHYSVNGDEYPVPLLNYVEKVIDNLHLDFLGNTTYRERMNDPLRLHLLKRLSGKTGRSAK